MGSKGWIALDIDGTITDNVHSIPKEVILFFKELVREGWHLVFVTGRTFSFGLSSLKALDFPYFLAVQNGSDILEMPSRHLFSQSYLKANIVEKLESAYRGQKEDFLIYAGYEKGDFCYYRPARFSQSFLEYLEVIKALSPEPWKPLETFAFSPEMRFPLIKCLGTKTAMQALNTTLETIPGVHATMIRDRFMEDLYLNLVTDAQATKGHALDRIMQQKKITGPVIAAGDDFNDLSMLHRADIRIVMETAPQEVLAKAHIIAPSASKQGIIQALTQAIEV